MTDIEQIARMCHEMNRVYCQLLGDYSQSLWEDAPEWQKESARVGVRFRLENPDAPASAQHDSWMADKVAAGWVYGPTKDVEAKTHPCIVAYDQLPPEQQYKDTIFCAVVDLLTKTPR
jgi:cytochrome c1